MLCMHLLRVYMCYCCRVNNIHVMVTLCLAQDDPVHAERSFKSESLFIEPRRIVISSARHNMTFAKKTTLFCKCKLNSFYSERDTFYYNGHRLIKTRSLIRPVFSGHFI